MPGGFYIYAIAGTSTAGVLNAESIDGNGEPVETLPQGDIAAIVCRCHADQYEVTRANMVAHQRVMEAAMKRWPILPVRFDTIAENREKIVEKLLAARHEEFRDLLDLMAGKAELGLKALWTDMPGIFEEVVEENRGIKEARNKKRQAVAPADAVRLGEMVKNALERKKKMEARRILRRFDGVWSDRKVNDVFGDPMVLNAAFLVENEREEEFDKRVEGLADETDGRIRVRYVGPIPPCNFVEIVVTW